MYVRLLRAKLVAGFQFGWYAQARFDVEVENAGYEKTVAIHFSHGGEERAEFVRTLPNGRELWSWTTPHDRQPGKAPSYRFHVACTVGGGTDRDDNGGWSYLLDGNHPLVLGASPLALAWDRRQHGELVGSVGVKKDLGSEKTVKVVYTTDGWETSDECAARFQSCNDHGVESWAFSARLGPEAGTVEFAIACETDGTMHWDNNFGANYR